MGQYLDLKVLNWIYWNNYIYVNNLMIGRDWNGGFSPMCGYLNGENDD